MAFKLEAIELREVLNRNVEPLTEYLCVILHFLLRLLLTKPKFMRSRKYEIDVLKKLRPEMCMEQTERGLG